MINTQDYKNKRKEYKKGKKGNKLPLHNQSFFPNIKIIEPKIQITKPNDSNLSATSSRPNIWNVPPISVTNKAIRNIT